MRINEIQKEDYRDFAEHFALSHSLRGKTIVVTGATGLLGACMVHCLLRLNERHDLHLHVICVVRNVEKAKGMFGEERDELHYHVHDFGEREPLQLTAPVDYLVHFASPTASQYFMSNPVETMQVGVEGTRQVLEYAKENRVASLVYVSSLEVYGTVYDDAEPLTEDRQGYLDPMQARSCYPMVKRAAECMCHAYAAEYGVPVKTARLAQTFGAGVAKDDNRVFAQFARNIIQHHDIVLHTTGELSRCYCYTTDAVDAILHILLEGKDGEAYNVANDTSYISVIDMARFLCDTFGTGIKPVIELKEGMGYSPVTKLRLCCEKLHALGWHPRYDLKEMFSRLIASMQQA